MQVKSEQEDFWLELSEIEKEEIQFGIKQLDSGKGVSFDDFLANLSKLYESIFISDCRAKARTFACISRIKLVTRDT